MTKLNHRDQGPAASNVTPTLCKISRNFETEPTRKPPCHSEPGAKPGEEPAVSLPKHQPKVSGKSKRIWHESGLAFPPHKCKKEPDCEGVTAKPWPLFAPTKHVRQDPFVEIP